MTIKTPERRHWRRSGAFYCLLRTYLIPWCSVAIGNFEHVITGWDYITSIERPPRQQHKLFHANASYLYPPKASEIPEFSELLRVYKMEH